MLFVFGCMEIQRNHALSYQIFQTISRTLTVNASKLPIKILHVLDQVYDIS